MKKQSGFTLIELVLVLIVVGVLSVTALPKLIGQSAFEDYTLRDQLISRLRLVQLQNMNADPSDDTSDNACYWVVVKDNCFYHEQTARVGESCASPSATNICNDDSYNQYNSVAFSDSMLATVNYRFNIQGKLIISNNLISAPFRIDIAGDNNLAIQVETEGYIHESTQ